MLVTPGERRMRGVNRQGRCDQREGRGLYGPNTGGVPETRSKRESIHTKSFYGYLKWNRNDQNKSNL